MFERFNDRSRRVLVLAQEEARLLDHHFIGTEHILLGLIHDGDGHAGLALSSLGITLEATHVQIEQAIGVTGSPSPGSPPFTPRAKKVLELSLRECIQLGHSFIGTGHLLLGLVHEGEGVGAAVLVSQGADLGRVRSEVLRSMSGEQEAPLRRGGTAVGPLSSSPAALRPPSHCSLCGKEIWESDHFVSGRGVAVCSECIEGAHEALGRGVPTDHEVFLPPRVFGKVPDDQAVKEIVAALHTAFRSGSTPEELREAIEDFDELYPFLMLAGERFPVPGIGAALERVRFIDGSHAVVQFRTLFRGGGSIDRRGHMARDQGAWKLTGDSMAEMLVAGGVRVPHSRSS